jgi:hypothetical protein
MGEKIARSAPRATPPERICTLRFPGTGSGWIGQYLLQK